MDLDDNYDTGLLTQGAWDKYSHLIDQTDIQGDRDHVHTAHTSNKQKK